MNEPTKIRRLAQIETRLDAAVESLERASEIRGALHRTEPLNVQIRLALERLRRIRADLKVRLIEMHTNEE